MYFVDWFKINLMNKQNIKEKNIWLLKIFNYKLVAIYLVIVNVYYK